MEREIIYNGKNILINVDINELNAIVLEGLEALHRAKSIFVYYRRVNCVIQENEFIFTLYRNGSNNINEGISGDSIPNEFFDGGVFPNPQYKLEFQKFIIQRVWEKILGYLNSNIASDREYWYDLFTKDSE